MKFLSVRVEHFRCIEKAKVDFAPGLNLLHGPNDLGKSSLALAIRAALLLQSGAKEHEEFVSWHGTGDPLVELVFESEPQRIWRLRKTFGSASAYLEFSKDGVDFTTDARGREVDGRLSEILKWGIAPPGGKGRPKGMPKSFLSTVLLAEQDGVGAIFDQMLADDSDESGKKQLITALQAMAEDPTFKTVLARVQERVDVAFNSSGGKKRGKNSPWVKWSEEIQRKQEHSDQCHQELLKTSAIELEIQGLLERQLDARATVGKAQDAVSVVEENLEKDRRRREVIVRLEERKARVAEISRELGELAEAERVYAEDGRQIEALATLREKAKLALNDASEKAQKAKDELARLESDDRIRERQLQQSALETQLADGRTQTLRLQATLESIRRIEAADVKVRKLDWELRALLKSAKDLQKKRESARKEREDLEQQERELRGIRSAFRRQAAQYSIEQAEKGLAQVTAWRQEATGKRATADALETAQPGFALPTREQLDQFRRLESDLRVAAAKLDVGLSVTLRPKRAMRISVVSDGVTATVQDLTGATFEATARRQMQLEIADVAELAISGGAADARQEAERLERRWAAEAAPILKAAGAASLDALAQLVEETARRGGEIQSARQEAARLEQRMADQVDWASLLSEGRKELAAADAELAGADRTKLEKSAAKLGIKTAADIDKRSAALRGTQDELAKSEKQQDGELSAAETRTVEKQKVLDEATRELESGRSAIEGDWQDALKQVLRQQAEVRKELEKFERDIERLATVEDESVSAARKSLSRCQLKLAESKTAFERAERELSETSLQHAIQEGALKTRRDTVAKLDGEGAVEALAGVEAELRMAPVPAQLVSTAILAEAQKKLDDTSTQLRDIDGKIREKRGALQQVGGEVARQRADDALSELQSAKDRAREVELEFEAWELLRKTMRDAEQEEGAHLGHALAEPIAERFAALTADRYGKLSLGPNLETHGISVAGEDRMVRLLSVGTREQLSTIFRVTLAQHLKTAVLLDDQLTQTDSERMTWLRDLLKQVAADIQVIVFTCRPDDYHAGRRKGADDEVRRVDLAQSIDRWGAR